MPFNLYLDLNIYNRPFDNQRQARIRLETSAILILGHIRVRAINPVDLVRGEVL